MIHGLRSNLYQGPEDDVASMELWLGDEEWAELKLEGVEPEAEGEKRLAGAQVVVHLCFRARAGEYMSWRFGFEDAPVQLERAARRRWWWGLPVADALAELERARAVLLSHERCT